MSRSSLLLACLILASCAGGETGEPTGPGGPTGPSEPGGGQPVIASVRITVNSSSLAVGDTAVLTATALDANGRTVSGATFEWSTGARNIARLVNLSGSSVQVTGISIGTAPITAKEQGSQKSHTGGLPIVAPPRPAGSLLIPTVRPVLNSRGDTSYVASLLVVDTAAAGRDRQIGILRTVDGDLTGLPSFPKASFPQLSGVADCPGGAVYGATLDGEFWRVDLGTGILSAVGKVSMGADWVEALTCDSNGMLVAGSGWGTLFRFSPTTGVSTLIRRATSTYIHGYAAVASAPDGRIAAGMVESFRNYPSEEIFAVINSATGSLEEVAKPEPPVFYGGQLVFRGGRLLGQIQGRLAEISIATGMVRVIRAINWQN